MHSLQAYKAQVHRIRRLVNEMLKVATVEPKSGNYVRFTTQLDNYDLDRLESILTPEAATKAYSSAFNIPPEWISRAALVARQGAMHTGQKTVDEEANGEKQQKRSRSMPNEENAAKRSKGPPPKTAET